MYAFSRNVRCGNSAPSHFIKPTAADHIKQIYLWRQTGERKVNISIALSYSVIDSSKVEFSKIPSLNIS